MIGRKQRGAALCVMVAAWNRYQGATFRVDVAGSNYRPLRDAETLGWVWFPSQDRVAFTPEGIAELQAYGIDAQRVICTFACPVCGARVAQVDRGDGMPQNPSCQNCARITAEATKRMRERLENPA
jgi:hypothetical protein